MTFAVNWGSWTKKRFLVSLAASRETGEPETALVSTLTVPHRRRGPALFGRRTHAMRLGQHRQRRLRARVRLNRGRGTLQKPHLTHRFYLPSNRGQRALWSGGHVCLERSHSGGPARRLGAVVEQLRLKELDDAAVLLRRPARVGDVVLHAGVVEQLLQAQTE